MSRDYGSVDVDIVARLHDRYDLPGLIRAHPDKYAAVSIHGGRYQEWERPSVFLHGHVADNVDLGDLTIDRIEQPPYFDVSPTHKARTWLLDPRAPKVEMPPELKERIARMRTEAKKIEEAE